MGADRLYTIAPGVSYALTSQWSARLDYTYDAANNALYTLPSADHAAYRNDIRNMGSLRMVFKF